MNHLFFRGRSNTITQRIAISFLVGTLIPTVVVVFILCFQFQQNYTKIAEDQMQVSGSLVADFLNEKFDSLDIITTTPCYADYFSSRDSMSPTDADYTIRYTALQSELQTLFNLTTYASPDISDLVVWSDGIANYLITYNEQWYHAMLQKIEKQPWYAPALLNQGRMTFTPIRDYSKFGDNAVYTTDAFFVTRQIRNLHNPQQNSMVIINLTTGNISKKLANLNLIYDTFVVITNETGDLIYSSRPVTNKLLRNVNSGSFFRQDADLWNSESFQLTKYNLNVHVVYSMNELHRQIIYLMLSAVVIYLTGLIAAYLLFKNYNHWITNSVNTLQKTLYRIETGDLQSHCPPLKVTEFDALGQSVNSMIDRLNDKIRNEYLMTIQQKSLQLYALQSQIQPHFLNNTLFSFIALNQIGERSTLNSALYSLSHLLRYVLSKERCTSLGSEYAFLQDYLSLQKLRFEQRMRYELICPEELRSIQIPRLILQPLVENAIIHGIEPSETPCFCQISAEIENNTLIISVLDNGVGFDAAQFQKKLDESAAAAADVSSEAFRNSTREKTSIGIYYVQERLKMWSPRGHMQVQRSENVTTAKLSIPMEDIIYETFNR